MLLAGRARVAGIGRRGRTANSGRPVRIGAVAAAAQQQAERDDNCRHHHRPRGSIHDVLLGRQDRRGRHLLARGVGAVSRHLRPDVHDGGETDVSRVAPNDLDLDLMDGAG